MRGHERHNTNYSWLTPPEIIDALGPFDLDPCACVGQPNRTATRMISLPEDGLAATWDGLVWLNPPYGTEVCHWLNKLAQHPDGGIALVFARTDTQWFLDASKSAHLAFFPRGRIRFHRPDGTKAANAGAPSVFFAWGDVAVARLLAIKRPGVFVRDFNAGVAA